MHLYTNVVITLYKLHEYISVLLLYKGLIRMSNGNNRNKNNDACRIINEERRLGADGKMYQIFIIECCDGTLKHLLKHELKLFLHNVKVSNARLDSKGRLVINRYDYNPASPFKRWRRGERG